MPGFIGELRNVIEGRTLEPGEPEYDLRRSIFNGMIDRRPGVIVQPIHSGDVLRTLSVVRENEVDLAIRGGGHNVAGLAVCDHGVVLDFALMREVRVNAVERTARVQPGATWHDFDQSTQEHSLATTGGIVSDTGVAGLTLGGGLGWLMGVHGLTCDNLRSAVVALANGEIVTASQSEHPDLFWALRGGGGNYGVVLDFEFDLHPVDRVYAGWVTYPIDRAEEALRRFVDLGDSAPDELTLSAVLATDPSGRKTVELELCFLGNEDAGKQVTKALEAPHLVADTRRCQRYADWQQALDDPYRRGRRSYWKALYVTRMDIEFFSILKDAMSAVPSPHTMLTFDHVHGAASRVPTDATAFRHRDKRYLFLINTNWDDPRDDETNVSWTRDLFFALERFGVASGYVNYLSNEGPSRVRDMYGDKTYARLAAIKRVYDPTNLFHINQNIEPGAGDST